MSFLSDARSRKEQRTGRKTQSVAVADRRAAERYEKNYPAKAKAPAKSASMNKRIATSQSYHQMKGSKGAARGSHARTRPAK